MEADAVRLEHPLIGVAVDEANGFVYVNEYIKQRITQFTVTSRTEAERKAAGSTVDIALTGARVLAGTQMAGAIIMPAIAVLSREELLVYHYSCEISVLTIVPAAAPPATPSAATASSSGRKSASDAARPTASEEAPDDSKRAGLLRRLYTPNVRDGSSRALFTDDDRRRVFAADYNNKRLTVHDVASGALLAELPGRPMLFADLIDDVILLVTDGQAESEADAGDRAAPPAERGIGSAGMRSGSRIHFVALDSIPGLK